MYKIKYTNFNKIGGVTDAENMVIDKSSNEKYLDELEYYGEEMLKVLENLDTPENLEYIRNKISNLDAEFTIPTSTNLKDLYVNFLNYKMDRFDNDFTLGKIFDEQIHQLGLLFERGAYNMFHVNVDVTPTIDQLGLLLDIASKKEFLDPIIEEYKKKEAYRILEPIYPNSSDKYDNLLESVNKILYNNDNDKFSWILILESEFDTEYVQNFLLAVSSPPIPLDFENILTIFVRNRFETFTESILSKRFMPGTNVQLGTNVQMSSEDKLNSYTYIIQHILTTFDDNQYIQKVGSLPVLSSSKQHFDLYIENISRLIQQNRDSFFSGLLANISNNWGLRERLRGILQIDEGDIETVVDGEVIEK